MEETVVSIMESISGDSYVSKVLAMSSVEYAALTSHQAAAFFFKDIPRQIAAWTVRIQQLKRAGDLVYLETLAEMYRGSVDFEGAVGRLAAQEAALSRAAQIAAADTAATAAEGTLVAGAGTTVAAIVLPVVALVAVGLALGAPYYQARQQAKKDGYASGFSKGFITGLLKWQLRNTIERFWDKAVGVNGFDESLPHILAAANNKGLIEGRVAGLAKDDKEKKNYLHGLRRLTDTTTAGWDARNGGWQEQSRARQVKISYVIDMATMARKRGILSDG
jgi:hypothetical protein